LPLRGCLLRAQTKMNLWEVYRVATAARNWTEAAKKCNWRRDSIYLSYRVLLGGAAPRRRFSSTFSSNYTRHSSS
jgi:hypothetical protein